MPGFSGEHGYRQGQGEWIYSGLDIGKAHGDSMVKAIAIVTGHGINHQ